MEPANPNASDDTKRVLNWLADLTSRGGNRVVSGQHVGFHPRDIDADYQDTIVDLHTATDEWLALIGSSFMNATPAQLEDMNDVLIPYWNAGGLIALDHHAYNPWTGDYCTDLTDRDLTELIDPESDVYDTWMADLDRVAVGLAALRDAGVVVIWRVFHEMTFTELFWWDAGAHGGDWIDGVYYPVTGPFVNMWQHMFDYFSYTKGLDNLLWVYAPAGETDNWCHVDSMWPGDGYVDIVSLTVYGDNLGFGSGDIPYERLLLKSKPSMFLEMGPHPTLDGSWDTRNLITAIKDDYPLVVLWQNWHSYPANAMALVDNQFTDELLDDSWVITRDEVNWQTAVEAAVYKDDANLQFLGLLEEASGTRYDSAPGGENDLTDNNAVLSSADCQEGGKSADFERDSDQSLSIADGSQTGLDITSALSITAWIKLESIAGEMAIAAKYSWDGENRAYYFFVSSGGKVSCRLSPDGTSGNSVTATGGTTLSTATWYHVAVVHNGANITIYLNGVVDSNGSDNPRTYAAGSIANTTASFRLGRTDNGYPLDGLMDEAAVLDRALSTSEVNDIYLNGIQDPAAGQIIPIAMGHCHRRH